MDTFTIVHSGGLQHGGYWIHKNRRAIIGPFNRLVAAQAQCDRMNLRAAARGLQTDNPPTGVIE